MIVFIHRWFKEHYAFCQINDPFEELDHIMFRMCAFISLTFSTHRIIQEIFVGYCHDFFYILVVASFRFWEPTQHELVHVLVNADSYDWNKHDHIGLYMLQDILYLWKMILYFLSCIWPESYCGKKHRHSINACINPQIIFRLYQYKDSNNRTDLNNRIPCDRKLELFQTEKQPVNIKHRW